MVKRMKHKVKTLVLASVSSVTLAACGTGNQSSEDSGGSNNQETQQQNVQVNVQSGITEAVEQARGSVVTVMNMQRATNNPYSLFGGSDGEYTEEDYTQAGTGSGAVYKVDGDTGYIFTNQHVIQGSDQIQVRFADGTTADAEVVGSDSWTDLAVLSVDAQHVNQVAEFGDSSSLTLGEPAIAIGSPLGQQQSVTSGVVSGLNRSVPVDTNMDGQYDWEMSAIQTDAAINPGNSGGPLINIQGQVIGINTLKVSSSTVEGMGFAIPSNEAQNIIQQLENQGEIVRPMLGITMIDLSLLTNEQRTNFLNLPEDVQEGIVIVEVSNGTPASEAGLQPNDVITGFNGEEVTSGTQLRQLIYETEVGQEVEIEFYRDGEQQTVTTTMQAGDQNSPNQDSQSGQGQNGQGSSILPGN